MCDTDSLKCLVVRSAHNCRGGRAHEGCESEPQHVLAKAVTPPLFLLSLQFPAFFLIYPTILDDPLRSPLIGVVASQRHGVLTVAKNNVLGGGRVANGEGLTPLRLASLRAQPKSHAIPSLPPPLKQRRTHTTPIDSVVA